MATALSPFNEIVCTDPVEEERVSTDALCIIIRRRDSSKPTLPPMSAHLQTLAHSQSAVSALWRAPSSQLLRPSLHRSQGELLLSGIGNHLGNRQGGSGGGRGCVAYKQHATQAVHDEIVHQRAILGKCLGSHACRAGQKIGGVQLRQV